MSLYDIFVPLSQCTYPLSLLVAVTLMCHSFDCSLSHTPLTHILIMPCPTPHPHS